MKIRCYNKKCFHIWDYRGENKKFVCCPKCRFKRLLSKCRLFYSKEHTKNNIQSDRPTDIPKEKPVYKKIIKQPKTDFIGPEKKVKEFNNVSDFNRQTRKQKDPLTIKEMSRDLIIKEIVRDPFITITNQEKLF